jgi:hypothetical protein
VEAHRDVVREDRDKVVGSKAHVSRVADHAKAEASAGHRVPMETGSSKAVTHHAAHANMGIKVLANMETKAHDNTVNRIKAVDTDSVPAAEVRAMHHAARVRLGRIANMVVRDKTGLTVRGKVRAVPTGKARVKADPTVRDRAADMDRVVRNNARVHKVSVRTIMEAAVAHRIASREIATGRLVKEAGNTEIVVVVSRACIPPTFAHNATVAATNHNSRAPAASMHPRRAVRVARRTIPSGTGRNSITNDEFQITNGGEISHS